MGARAFIQEESEMQPTKRHKARRAAAVILALLIAAGAHPLLAADRDHRSIAAELAAVIDERASCSCGLAFAETTKLVLCTVARRRVAAGSDRDEQPENQSNEFCARHGPSPR